MAWFDTTTRSAAVLFYGETTALAPPRQGGVPGFAAHPQRLAISA